MTADHDTSNRAQLRSVSFWAAAPHYIPSGSNPKAAIALVQRVTQFLGVTVDTDSFGPAVQSWEERVTELISENDALAEYVQRLEETTMDELARGDLPSGDAIAAEVERFLREHGSGG